MAFKPLEWIRFGGRANFVRRVHDAAIAAELSPQAAALLTAQAAHETAWGKRVMNCNLAGVKANGWWREHRDYTTVATRECVPCKPGEQPSPECPPGQRLEVLQKAHWRAYPSLVDGVRGIVSLLGADRYEQSKKLLLAGDERFFRQLGADGWYTASPEVYEKSSLERLGVVAGIVEDLRWQRALLAWEGDCLPRFGADGMWGGESKAALLRFQKAEGLAESGERDDATATRLFGS